MKSVRREVVIGVAILRVAIILFAVALVYVAVTSYNKGVAEANERHKLYIAPTPLPGDPNFPQVGEGASSPALLSSATASLRATPTAVPPANPVSPARDYRFIKDTMKRLDVVRASLEAFLEVSSHGDEMKTADRFERRQWFDQLDVAVTDLQGAGAALTRPPDGESSWDSIELSPSVKPTLEMREALRSEIMAFIADLRAGTPMLKKGNTDPPRPEKVEDALIRLRTIVPLVTETYELTAEEAKKILLR